MRFVVSYLQAVEPESLDAVEGIYVRVVEECDDMGFPRVDVFGPTRDAVISYVREQWCAEEDPAWFESYVVARVETTI